MRAGKGIMRSVPEPTPLPEPMEKILLPLHLTFVGLWLGCVFTEVLFERALWGHGRANSMLLAGLHKRVDVLVEVPAFMGVLLTGWAMMDLATRSSLLYTKLGFAYVAVIGNMYCVRLVFKRHLLARQGHWHAFSKVDRLQHKVGALVLVGILGALGLGMYSWGSARAM